MPSERFMQQHYGASGYAPKRKGLNSIAIDGIWLRRIGSRVEVLAEVDRQWRIIIVENVDGQFSHIVEPGGIAAAPIEGEKDV